jgi:hypothetical protein
MSKIDFMFIYQRNWQYENIDLELFNNKMNEINWNDGMYCIKEKIGPSRESEPKDFHLNYYLVGLSIFEMFTFSFV